MEEPITHKGLSMEATIYQILKTVAIALVSAASSAILSLFDPPDHNDDTPK